MNHTWAALAAVATVFSLAASSEPPARKPVNEPSAGVYRAPSEAERVHLGAIRVKKWFDGTLYLQGEVGTGAWGKPGTFLLPLAKSTDKCADGNCFRATGKITNPPSGCKDIDVDLTIVAFEKELFVKGTVPDEVSNNCVATYFKFLFDEPYTIDERPECVCSTKSLQGEKVCMADPFGHHYIGACTAKDCENLRLYLGDRCRTFTVKP